MASAERSEAGGRRGRGGADARRAARSRPKVQPLPFIVRKIPLTTVLDEEGLDLIERNADTILEEVGIDFRDDAEALQLWREPAPTSRATGCAFPAAWPRSIIKTAPREFVQHARNPERTSRSAATHRIRAGLWPALHPQPRRGPALRARSRISATS
jgi:trimethylamine--corrinoid protein Co-methyltransferase